MTKLQSYRQTLITPDTYDALCRLERTLATQKQVLLYEGVSHQNRGDPGPLGLPSPLSMRATGREVYLRLESQNLAALWGSVVPLGFVPWDRYPVPSQTSHVFHYMGPWARLGDFLHGEGMGDAVWPSICCAAQIEVGVWAGDRLLERSVQTHLHRLGVHCGPVDGQINPVATSALKALGLGGKTLEQVLPLLEKLQPPKDPQKQNRNIGHVVFNGPSIQAFTSGGINTVRTRTGYTFTVEGSGKLILTVED